MLTRDANKSVFSQYDLIDLIEQRINDVNAKHEVIVDAKFDSYREGNIWVMLKNTQKGWLFLKSMRIESKEVGKNILAQIVDEDILISPSLIQKYHMDVLEFH